MTQSPPLQLTFASNQLLQDLCGRHDSHLQLVEDNLGVQLVARGNQLAIFGPPEQARQAQQVLEDLYELLKQGLPITPPQVEAALRLSGGLLDTQLRPADLLHSNTTIVTPLTKIMPRSVTQHRYAAALQRMLDAHPKAPRKLAASLWQALQTPLPDEADAPLARVDDRDRKTYKRLQDAVAERSAALGLPDGVLASRRWLEALQDGEDWPGPLAGWRRTQLEPALSPVLATIGKR